MRSDQIIWILEDEQDCQFVYEQVLGFRYKVRFFPAIADFQAACAEPGGERPQLIIADLRLFDGVFTDFISHNPRLQSIPAPFIVVSSFDDLDVIRFCLQRGAQDYLVKPFKSNELIVKVERILKAGAEAVDPLMMGLTLKERLIFSLFMESPDHLVSREDLVKKVWQDTRVDMKTIDVHIHNLRKKVEAQGYRIRSHSANQWALLR